MRSPSGIAFINPVGNLGGFYGAYFIGARRSSGGGLREGILIIAGLLTLAAILAVAVRARPNVLRQPWPILYNREFCGLLGASIRALAAVSRLRNH
jgi:hypothetical protein